MTASLALAQGMVWIAREERGLRVGGFDLDGRRVTPDFVVPPLVGERADAHGLSVDADRRLWLADRGARALRAFSVFGNEVARAPLGIDDLAGIAADGVEGAARLLVSAAGERRHALFLCGREGEDPLSLRPLGDPQAVFRGLTGVALRGSLAYACESGASQVQVFRDGEFHFVMRCAGREPFRPRAVAALADGRVLVAHAGEQSSLLCFDASGRLARVIAEDGWGEGALSDPLALAVDEGRDERSTRIVVLDQAGLRVQVFALDGRSFGCFPEFADATLRS